MWLHLLSFRETAAIYYSMFFYKYLQIFNNFYVFIGTALMAVQQAASLKKAGSLWKGRQVLESADWENQYYRKCSMQFN